MDEEPSSYLRPPKRPNVRTLSKAPSWLLLGFVLGAGFIWLLPGPDRAARRAPAEKGAGEAVRVEPAEPSAPAARSVTTIEAVFDQWGQYAIWENDLTQVALWNAEKNDFADCYEVMKNGDLLYFRSIPRLTRPVVNYGGQITSPLQYTETESMRAARAKGLVLLVPNAAPAAPATPSGRRLVPMPPSETPKAIVTPPPMLPTPQAKPLVPPDSVLPATPPGKSRAGAKRTNAETQSPSPVPARTADEPAKPGNP